MLVEQVEVEPKRLVEESDYAAEDRQGHDGVGLVEEPGPREDGGELSAADGEGRESCVFEAPNPFGVERVAQFRAPERT